MRMLMHVKFPNEKFNEAVKDGSVEKKIKNILEEATPETVYFTNYNGQRGVIMIIDLADSSKVPSFAEPWFLNFNADVEFHIVMTPEDLGRAGLGEIGRKWS